MQMKYSKGKRRKITTFSVGEVVSVRVPRIDRTSTDLHRLVCVIVECQGKEHLSAQVCKIEPFLVDVYVNVVLFLYTL